MQHKHQLANDTMSLDKNETRYREVVQLLVGVVHTTETRDSGEIHEKQKNNTPYFHIQGEELERVNE